MTFYKLYVLKYLCNTGFEKIVYLDTAVYIQGNFELIWKEVKQKILLYDINHGLKVEDYRILCHEVESFMNSKKDYILHIIVKNFLHHIIRMKCSLLHMLKEYMKKWFEKNFKQARMMNLF